MKTRLISLALLLSTSLGAAAYDWQTDLQHRLRCDFTADRESVLQYIRQYIPHVTDEKLAQWEASGALECMELDGQKKYFSLAARNLFRIDPQCAAVWAKAHPGTGYANSTLADMKNIPQILRDAPHDPQHIAQARRMRITYTISVQPDAVPAGQKVRCWMPFPRRDQARQTDVELISTNLSQYILADPAAPHSTLYMEQAAVAGLPTVFQETFEYTAHGAKFDLGDVQPYDKGSKLYRQYTSEREKHIIFTPELRALADSLTRGIINPACQAQAIFEYISRNFPWASAREYSTIDNIPMYVLQNRHGDCGQVSLLFITLCRICGIPARWQSGFQVHPGGENLHDWAEAYFEGVGWVPVDQSYGIADYMKSPEGRMFFFGGIDSWRLIVNSEYGQPLFPKKKFPRSETVDFQRGEIEWAQGNVYFDQWDWNIRIEYLD